MELNSESIIIMQSKKNKMYMYLIMDLFLNVCKCEYWKYHDIFMFIILLFFFCKMSSLNYAFHWYKAFSYMNKLVIDLLIIF